MISACATTHEPAIAHGGRNVSIVIHSILPHEMEFYLDDSGTAFSRKRVLHDKARIENFNEASRVARLRMSGTELKQYLGTVEYLHCERRDSAANRRAMDLLRERVFALKHQDGDPRMVEDGITITCVFFDGDHYDQCEISNNDKASQAEMMKLLRQIWPETDALMR